MASTPCQQGESGYCAEQEAILKILIALEFIGKILLKFFCPRPQAYRNAVQAWLLTSVTRHRRPRAACDSVVSGQGAGRAQKHATRQQGRGLAPRVMQGALRYSSRKTRMSCCNCAACAARCSMAASASAMPSAVWRATRLTSSTARATSSDAADCSSAAAAMEPT